MGVAKWVYILTFDLEDYLLEQPYIEQFDHDVVEKIREVADAYGAKYELIPTPDILVKHLPSKESDGRGS